MNGYQFNANWDKFECKKYASCEANNRNLMAEEDNDYQDGYLNGKLISIVENGA